MRLCLTTVARVVERVGVFETSGPAADTGVSYARDIEFPTTMGGPDASLQLPDTGPPDVRPKELT